MNILLCGSCLPEKYEGIIQNLSPAGNKFQNNLIRALKLRHDVKIVSFINYNVEIEYEELKKECEKIGIIPVFIQGKKLQAFQEYRQITENLLNWTDIVITYNILYPWFGIAQKAQKMGKKAVSIIADYTNWKEESSLLKKLYALFIIKELRNFKNLIVLSSSVKEFSKKKQNIYVMNGAIQVKDFEEIKEPKKKGNINFVYTGGLSKVVGTDLLIKAFTRIKNDNIRLFISGHGGELTDSVKNINELDPRIVYLGFLSRDEYMKLLAEADVLINPRNMDFKQNKYNFPSKILEYLATGRIVISTRFYDYKLYEKYILFCESSVDGLQKAYGHAIELINKKHTEDIYIRNRDFSKSLDWNIQINSILEKIEMSEV